MLKAITPASFVRRQLVAVSAPWVVSILVGGAALAAVYVYFRGSSSALDLGVFIMLTLCSGGGALGYAAWNISQLRAGLVPTPKQRWQAEMRDGAVLIRTGKLETSVPLGEIASVTYVDDDSWDRIRGMETHGVVLHLAGGGRIAIPGSTLGSTEVLTALRASHAVDNVSV